MSPGGIFLVAVRLNRHCFHNVPSLPFYSNDRIMVNSSHLSTTFCSCPRLIQWRLMIKTVDFLSAAHWHIYTQKKEGSEFIWDVITSMSQLSWGHIQWFPVLTWRLEVQTNWVVQTDDGSQTTWFYKLIEVNWMHHQTLIRVTMSTRVTV